jgi:hypothetical protein
MRDSLTKYSLSGALLVAIAGSAVAACSAGSDSNGLSGLGTAGAGAGGPGGGASGFGAQGGFIGAGSDPGIGGITGLGAGGAAGGGTAAGGAPTMTSDGHFGPASINTCADAAKFGGGAGANRLLYPYDGTVFPRGLGGPLLMWDAPADQILIEAKSSKFSYVDCPMTPDKVRYVIPNDAWTGAGSWSDGPGDPLVVKVTALSGGKAVGAVTVNLKFALTTLKGAIYYNTYGTPKTNNNGAVMKLVPGQPAPTLFLTDNGVAPLGPCRSCHALSANGMTMTANRHIYPGGYVSESYDVTGPTPTLVNPSIVEAGFAGIFPDGSRLMTNGPPNPSKSPFFPTADGNVTALVASTAKLLDMKSGQPLNAPGWAAPHAQMPMFSPNGKRIVYNDYDKGAGHSLWIADFNPANNTFSGQKQIFTNPQVYAAWPFFTPDSQQVVFALDTRADYTSQVPDVFGPPAMTPTGRGHLMIIDLASGIATNMDLANGYRNGQPYLPPRDLDLEFFPTVSPIAGGGFSWALFTSRRTFGNLWVKGIEDPVGKKIWVTAISIGVPAGQDPSNPPFFLPGQDIESGNIRAFAALEPCKEDGNSCAAGSECCKGFCSNINPTTGLGICGKLTTTTCARVDDKCTTDADCCTGPDNGVGGRALFCIATAGSAFCAQKGIQ